MFAGASTRPPGTVTWRGDLLDQGEELANRCAGPFCPSGSRLTRQVGRRDRDAEPHRVAVGDEDGGWALWLPADREDWEAPPEERMGRVCYLDLLGSGRRWVVERGIKVGFRSRPGNRPA